MSKTPGHKSQNRGDGVSVVAAESVIPAKLIQPFHLSYVSVPP